MRRIAWVGTKSRYIVDEFGDRVVDYNHENHRDIPMWVGGHAASIRVVGKAEGLSKEYVFGGGKGPESFILEMTDEDADRLMSLPGTSENFQDATHDPGFFERTYRPLEEIFAEGTTA